MPWRKKKDKKDAEAEVAAMLPFIPIIPPVPDPEPLWLAEDKTPESPQPFCNACTLLTSAEGLKTLFSRWGYIHYNITECQQSSEKGCEFCKLLIANVWPTCGYPLKYEGGPDRLRFWATGFIQESGAEDTWIPDQEDEEGNRRVRKFGAIEPKVIYKGGAYQETVVRGKVERKSVGDVTYQGLPLWASTSASKLLIIFPKILRSGRITHSDYR